MSKFKINPLPKNAKDPFAKDPFAKATFDQQLKDRLANKTFPHQEDTYLCGPAAFFYCLQIKHPAFYRMAATQLYETGSAQIANLRIEPDASTLTPNRFFHPDGRPRISGLDWVTMASLRDGSNQFIDYESPSDFIAPITTQSQMSRWFE